MAINRSVVNSLASGGAFFWSAVLAIVVRAEFVHVLGVQWLGLDALFSSILGFVALAELGVGSAVTFAFFKPIREGDYPRVLGLLRVLARFYRWIMVATLVSGALLGTVLPYISDFDIGTREFSLFGIALVAYSASYLFAEYKALALAMQMNYLESAARVLLVSVKSILQWFALAHFQSYGLFVASVLFANVLSNVLLRHLVRRRIGASLCAGSESPPYSELKRIYRNIMGGVFHRFGSAVVTGTDNILISVFVGTSTLGLYSSYSMLFFQLSAALGQVVYPLAGTIGGVKAHQGGLEAYKLFKKIFLIFSYFVMVASLSIAFCIDDVIRIWLGNDLVLHSSVGLMLAINFFVIVMRRPSILSIDAFGLQWEIRYKSPIEAAVNAVASLILILAFDLGVIGVIAGTLLSNLVTNLWWEPFVIYRGVFGKGLREYFVMYGKSLFQVLSAALVLVYMLSESAIVTSFSQLALKVIVVWLVATMVFGILNVRALRQIYAQYGGRRSRSQ